MSEYPAEYVHELRRESEQQRDIIERSDGALEQILRDLRLALATQQHPEEEN